LFPTFYNLLLATKAVLSIISDLVCIALVSVPSVILLNTAEPYKRGFFCNDETIKHPYKDSTVSSQLYVTVSMVIPSLAILAVELTHWTNFKKYFGTAYSALIVFYFVYTVNELLTSISKYTIGRLRPHFLEVCNPNITLNEDSCGSVYNPKYITEFDCLGSSQFGSYEDQMSRVKDSRMSFMSGHSSATTYAMLFAAMYIQNRLKTRHFQIVKAGVQMFCIVFAFYTCLSRISDYKHHPEDVITGALLGSAEAVLAVFVFFPKSRKRFSSSTSKQLEYADPNEKTSIKINNFNQYN